MQIGKFYVHPWNRKNFLPRLIVLVIIFGWLAWGVVLWQENQQLADRRREREQQLQFQQERIRRQAAYERHLLEQQAARESVQNAVDSFRTKGE